jgi:ADP-ribose pyrophosphatase YjhB (NUDIX family)
VRGRASLAETMEIPRVRVLCVADDRRVLLLRRRVADAEPDGWELPGEEVDPGESPLDAARRSLHRETGLPGDRVIDRWVLLAHDYRRFGERQRHVAAFYLAPVRFAVPVAPVSGVHSVVHRTYRGHGWFLGPEILDLDVVTPPPVDLLAVLGVLL